LNAAWASVQNIIQTGGLISLLWHNNYFNEPEYADWQMVYEKLLERLALLSPWCATGTEINSWWRARSDVTVQVLVADNGGTQLQLHAPVAISDLALDIHSPKLVRPEKGVSALESIKLGTRVHFAALRAGQTVTLSIAC
jgi:hypothetical protein